MHLQPYLSKKEGLPESRRTEHTMMGKVEPMMPHKATQALEKKPTQ